MFSVLNKWSTKKANITWGFYLGDVRLQRFLFLPFHNQSVSARMIIAYGFFRLYKKKNAPPSTATHLD